MKDKIQGEQFIEQLRFTGAGYDQCEQMIFVVYNTNTQSVASAFVKVADDKFPGAELVVKNEYDAQVVDLFFSAEKTATMLGKYSIEIKRVISGTQMPVIKNKMDVYNFTTSKTV